MTKHGRPDADDTLDHIERVLSEDMLDPATPIDTVRLYLRAAGGNPDRIRAEGAAHIQGLLDQRRLAWQEAARRRIERRAPFLQRVVELASMGKGQLLARFNELRDDSVGGPLLGAFHKRKPEESSEAELRSLIEEIESLRMIEVDEGNEGER